LSRVADPTMKISLLRAAEQVFAERGLGSAKVEEIARRANVSKGAFYLHFDSKEAALKELLESFLARCKSFFVAPTAFTDLPDDPIGLLDFAHARDVQIFDFLWQNRAFLRILPTCQGNHDYLVIAFRAEVHVTAREWVDHYRRHGIFREEVDAELASTLISGAYNELSARMIAQEKRPPFEEWLRFGQETFFRAFGTPKMVAALADGNQPVNLAGGRTSRGTRVKESG
jgi:AcrR family transcriptional regulator